MTESIWAHSQMFTRYCEDRSRGAAPEVDCVRQLARTLEPLTEPGMTVLDVGCAAGHYYWSLRSLGLDYYGIDGHPPAIEIGRRNMPAAGLSPSRLRCLRLEELHDETYTSSCVSTRS